MGHRFPRALYARGAEPDPRFSLANERTFLAWVRTSLALLAAGVALEALAVPVSPGFRLAAATVFVVAGTFAAVQGWVSWYRTERALRENAALPGGFSYGVILAAVVVAVLLLVLGYLL